MRGKRFTDEGVHLRSSCGAAIALVGEMANDKRVGHLRYLNTDRLDAPFVDPLDVRTRGDVKVGRFDGVIVDPSARRVRYLVIERGRLFHERVLIPLVPTRIDPEHHALRLEVDDVDPSAWQKFDTGSCPPFSDDDLVTALFAHSRVD